MNLQDFVKNVLIEINAAVDDARQQTSRDIRFTTNAENRTIEFDIAVSAEEVSGKGGKGGVKVLQFAEIGGDIAKANKNSTVSRVVFGLHIEPRTREEAAAMSAAAAAHNEHVASKWPNIY